MRNKSLILIALISLGLVGCGKETANEANTVDTAATKQEAQVQTTPANQGFVPAETALVPEAPVAPKPAQVTQSVAPADTAPAPEAPVDPEAPEAAQVAQSVAPAETAPAPQTPQVPVVPEAEAN